MPAKDRLAASIETSFVLSAMHRGRPWPYLERQRGVRYRRRLLGPLVIDAVLLQQLLQLIAGGVHPHIENGHLRVNHWTRTQVIVVSVPNAWCMVSCWLPHVVRGESSARMESRNQSEPGEHRNKNANSSAVLRGQK